MKLGTNATVTTFFQAVESSRGTPIYFTMADQTVAHFIFGRKNMCVKEKMPTDYVHILATSR